jgi:hypothetical protein
MRTQREKGEGRVEEGPAATFLAAARSLRLLGWRRGREAAALGLGFRPSRPQEERRGRPGEIQHDSNNKIRWYICCKRKIMRHEEETLTNLL